MRGTPSTSESMITPKPCWSCVCLNSLFSTTCGMQLFLSSMTTRMPLRSDSSRRSLISVSFFSRTRSAILVTSLDLFTWYGNLGDDDPRASGRGLLDVGLATRRDRAAPGLVGRADAVAAHDRPAGGEVRARDDGHELVDGDVRVVDQHDDAVDDLAEVVRRDVGRHADRDARAAVDEQVREAARQHERLGRATRRSWDRSRPSPCRGRAEAPSPCGGRGPRCSASPPPSRRRPSRSCRARRRAVRAWRRAGPCAPSCRRPPSPRAGGTCR